jgi:hypothetical protein
MSPLGPADREVLIKYVSVTLFGGIGRGTESGVRLTKTTSFLQAIFQRIEGIMT